MTVAQTAALLALLLLAAAAIPETTSARQTPAAGADCAIAPRAFSEIVALSESPLADAAPARPLPAGEPADAETTAAIASTLAEMGACLTAGEMLRFYALHSDTWVRRFAASAEGLTTLTTSTPPLADGDRAVYLGPWGVRLLPDGRVLAAALLRVGDELRPDPARTRVLVFVKRDGRWLVDETIEEVRLPGCAEPVAVAAAVGPPPGALFDAWSAACRD